MSVDARLYINAKWGPGDIQDILISLGAKDVKIEATSVLESPMMVILFNWEGERRMMHFHHQTETPIGYANLLTLGHDVQSDRIMNGIMKRIGGVYQQNDSEEIYTMSQGSGMLWEEDGIAYFLKEAVKHGKMKNGKDIQGLKDYMDEWHEKMGA